MSSEQVYLWGAILLAIALDVWLTYRAWRYRRGRSAGERQNEPEVRFLGLSLPMLTWLRYRSGVVVRSIKGFALEPARITERVGPVVVFFATVFLAALPSWRVLQDRWLGDPAVTRMLGEPWHKIEFLRQLALPPYFAIVLACFVGLLALIVLQKDDRLVAAFNSGSMAGPVEGGAAKVKLAQSRIARALQLGSGVGFAVIAGSGIVFKRSPGWDLVLVLVAYMLGWLLRERPVEDMATWWRQNWGWWVACLAAHISLIGFLASYYSESALLWVFAVLLAAATVNLLRYIRQVPLIFWIVTLAIVLYTLNINAWWFSVVGDEYSFYNYAREIAEKHSLSFVGSHLFNGLAVYGAHPYFSSLLQAISIKLLGSQNFGWRFSSLYLSAVAIGFLYLFFKTFVSDRVALMASLFLAASHYIMSFGKIGYNNLQALWAMALALWAAAWAIRAKRPIAFVALGMTLGLCFYVYPAALYIVPLPVLLLLFYFPPTSRPALRQWAVTVVSMVMLIFPLFLQPDYWKAKVAGTIYYNPRVVQTVGSVVSHFVTNLIYSFFSFIYTPQESHFVAASYVDPLTAAFVAIGIACLLRLIRRERFAAFLMVGLAALLFLVGTTHDRRFPPATRMFLLLPWFVLLAAIGLMWVIGRIERLKLIGLSATGVIALVAPIVIGLNLYQAYTLSWQRMSGLQSFDSLFLRMAQRSQEFKADPLPTFVIVTGPGGNIGPLQLLQQIYSAPRSPAQLVQVTVVEQGLESSRAVMADRNALVIIEPEIDAAQQKALEPSLRGLGKVPCSIRNTQGDARFTLWHSPEWARLCR